MNRREETEQYEKRAAILLSRWGRRLSIFRVDDEAAARQEANLHIFQLDPN